MFKTLVILSLTFYVSYSSKAPIIGVLTQEIYIIAKFFPGEHHDCFIAASFVKFLESGGAQVIPVWIGQSEEYYRKIVQYTNGMLFPGGGTFFNETKGYGEAAQQIYDFALEANAAGTYYPILGEALGLEVLPFAALNSTDIRVDCVLKNKAVPLMFTKGYRRSKLFSKTTKNILDILAQDNVTYNNHRFCITKQSLEENKILPDWKMLSTNRDQNGLEFISTMEHKQYPIYGISFDAGKNQFVFTSSGIPHTSKAVKVAQYFADFFVNECRNNNNDFPVDIRKENILIYNFNPRYIGSMNGSFYEQVYVFNLTHTDTIEAL